MPITSIWSTLPIQEISIAVGIICSVVALFVKGTDIIDYFIYLKMNRLSKLKSFTHSLDLQEAITNKLDDCIFFRLTRVSDPLINRQIVKLINFYSNTIEQKKIEFFFHVLLYINKKLVLDKTIKITYWFNKIFACFMITMSIFSGIFYAAIAINFFIKGNYLAFVFFFIFILVFAALTKLFSSMLPKKNVEEITRILNDYNDAQTQQ